MVALGGKESASKTGTVALGGKESVSKTGTAKVELGG
jgi:hypothetical protein